jgi:pSer/pThr/pTyr-binding forkhead associated (FHA) protein
MAASPLGPHQASPAELHERLEAERRGDPFLLFRDGDQAQRIVSLADVSRLVVGRSPECELCVSWDASVSRLHAALECVGTHWTVVDDGLSRNGTVVGGERIAGRRRLVDRDVIEVGDVVMVFRQPGAAGTATTRLSNRREVAAHVTEAQQRVLIALCRPFKGGIADAVPATNPQIAQDLFLTVAAVKTHLRLLFRAFGIDDLPPQQKRRQLVALAFSSGAVRERDL